MVKRRPRQIPVNKIELIKLPSLENISEGNVLQLDISEPELIERVDVLKEDYESDKWPSMIWTLSRGTLETGEPSIISKLYEKMYVDTIEGLGIGLFIPEGLYLRHIFGGEGDRYGVVNDKSFEIFNAKLKKAGL